LEKKVKNMKICKNTLYLDLRNERDLNKK